MDDVTFFTSQDEFSNWLEAHHAEASELWVGFFRKHTDRAGPTWSEAVDVALCYGWIDGIRKTIDADRYRIRFTPRKPGSIWSAVNVQKATALIEQGKMTPAGMTLFDNRSDAQGYSAASRQVPLDQAYEDKIRTNHSAWAFFSSLAPSYKRDSIWWVMSAKREATRLKRLEVLINSSAEGQKIPSLRKN